MTPLRQRMIEETRIRNFSKYTIAAYVSGVLTAWRTITTAALTSWIVEEIRAFLVDLVEQKQVFWPYYKQVLSSLRFFYRHVVRHGEVVEDVRGPGRRSDCRSC